MTDITELRALVAKEPTNAEAQFKLGHALALGGRLEESEQFLKASVALDSTLVNVKFLADVYFNQKKFSDALPLARAVAAAASGVAIVWQQLGEVEAACGNTKQAADAFRRALSLEPHNVSTVMQFAYQQNFVDPVENVRTLQNLLPAVRENLGTYTSVLRLLIPYLEEERRVAAGLPAGIGATAEDSEIKFSIDELRELYKSAKQWFELQPTKLDAAVATGLAAAALGDYEFAESAFSVARPRLGKYPAVSVDLRLTTKSYALSTKSDQVLSEFPPLKTLIPWTVPPSRTLFVAADQGYFDEYIVVLIGSMVTHRTPIHLHIHVFDPDVERVRSVVDAARRQGMMGVSVTTENIEPQSRRNSDYYHTVRFVRFMQYVMAVRQPAWLIDADFLVNGDPGRLFDALDGHDLGLLLQPTRLELNNKVGAGFVGLSGSSVSINYARIVSALLAKLCSEDRVRWGADQFALYLAMRYLREQEPNLKIVPLTPELTDRSFKTDNVFWNSKAEPGSPHAPLLQATRAAAVKALWA
jgi:tetratricopeptide (TPR) repeat protein